jgi:phage host-nuclease inhibitor protein Gam
MSAEKKETISIEEADAILGQLKDLDEQIKKVDEVARLGTHKLREELRIKMEGYDNCAKVYQTEKENLEKKLEAFALADRDVWEGSELLLTNGVLKVSKTPPSLEINTTVPQFLKVLKEQFKDEDYYMKFVRIKTEFDKTAIKNAVKTGVFSDEFNAKAKIELVSSDKFSYSFSMKGREALGKLEEIKQETNNEEESFV